MTTPTDLFAIVPVAHRPPEEAIVVGPLKEVFEYIPQSIARADAEARLDEGMTRAAKTEELQGMTRACNAIAFADSVDRLVRRLDEFEERREQRAREDAQREAEEEAKAIQDALDALPDPDDPTTYEPTGELHTLPPKEGPASDAGGVPLSYKNVPLSYVRTKDQTEVPEPEHPSGSVVPQPTAIELNNADEP
jgi:hypothetical protein